MFYVTNPTHSRPFFLYGIIAVIIFLSGGFNRISAQVIPPVASKDSLVQAMWKMPLAKRQHYWVRLIFSCNANKDTNKMFAVLPRLEQDLQKIPDGRLKSDILRHWIVFLYNCPHPKRHPDGVIRQIEQIVTSLPEHQRTESSLILNEVYQIKYERENNYKKAEFYMEKRLNDLIANQKDTVIHEIAHFSLRQFYFNNQYFSPLQLRMAEAILAYAQKRFSKLWLAEMEVIVGEITANHDQLDKGFQLIAQGMATIEKIMPGSTHMMNEAGATFAANGNYALALRYQRKVFWKLFKDYKITGDITKGRSKDCLQCNVDITQFAINLCTTFQKLGQLDSMLYYAQIAHNYARAGRSDFLVTVAKNRIAQAYFLKKNYTQYIPVVNDFLIDYQKHFPKVDIAIIANLYLSLHTAYHAIRQRDSADYYFQKGIRYYDSIPQMPVNHKITRFENEMLYYRDKDPKKALRSADSLIFYKDSLIREKDKLKISDALMRYDTESRDSQINLLNKEKELSDLQSRHKNILIFGVASLLLLAVGVVGLLFARNRSKQRTNKLLASQNTEIQKMNHELADAVGTIQLQNEEISNAYEELNATLDQVQHQKEEIQQKNEKIEDSIRYAYQIQTAILPDPAHLKTLLPNHYIFYQPKDIVSGDFYWVTERENLIFFCVADCTGHGVPGAFMSVVGSNALHNVINELGIIQPDLILHELDRKIRHTLRQEKNSESKDGMDVCLCVWDQNDNSLRYAGAGRPLYHLSNGNLEEIKGDKFPIGGGQHENKTFTAHRLTLQKGDRIYLFSDGITDQFGGAQKKKFTPKRLQEFILQNQSLNLAEQGQQFHDTMSDWMKGQVQLDDLTLMAVAF